MPVAAKAMALFQVVVSAVQLAGIQGNDTNKGQLKRTQ